MLTTYALTFNLLVLWSRSHESYLYGSVESWLQDASLCKPQDAAILRTNDVAMRQRADIWIQELRQHFRYGGDNVMPRFWLLSHFVGSRLPLVLHLLHCAFSTCAVLRKTR